MPSVLRSLDKVCRTCSFIDIYPLRSLSIGRGQANKISRFHSLYAAMTLQVV